METPTPQPEKVFETQRMVPFDGHSVTPEPKQVTVDPTANGSPTVPVAGQTVKPETPAEPVKPVTPEVTAPVDESVSAEEFYSYLNQSAGAEIKSEDDLVQILKEWKELKSDPLKGVDPLIKEAIKAQKSGIPISRFFALSQMDYEKMSPKEVLFQQFVNRNAQYGQSMEFARKLFEKEFKNQFDVLSKDGMTREQFAGTDDEWRQLQEDVSFAKEKLVFDGSLAKRELEALKAQALTPEPQQPPKTPEQLVLEEKQRDAEIERALNFDKLALPMEGGDYEVDITGPEKETVKMYAKEPLRAIKDFFGIDTEKEHTDYDQLITALTYLTVYQRLAGDLTPLAVERKNKDVVTNQLENPRTGVAPQRQGTVPEKEAPGQKFTKIK